MPAVTSQNHSPRDEPARPHSRENEPIRGKEAAVGAASCQLMHHKYDRRSCQTSRPSKTNTQEVKCSINAIQILIKTFIQEKKQTDRILELQTKIIRSHLDIVQIMRLKIYIFDMIETTPTAPFSRHRLQSEINVNWISGIDFSTWKITKIFGVVPVKV